MGVYDFFKGQCPNCPKTLDDHSEFGICGDIQTKYFITDESCFREFFPGNKVPFAPGENFIIGRTCCCNTIIKACFDGDKLLEYTVVVKEKFKYIKNEMNNSFQKFYMPQKDLDWWEHRNKWIQNDIEKYIVQIAWRPQKISYYLSLGYTLEQICSF
jgi:hypothetical protein